MQKDVLILEEKGGARKVRFCVRLSSSCSCVVMVLHDGLKPGDEVLTSERSRKHFGLARGGSAFREVAYFEECSTQRSG